MIRLHRFGRSAIIALLSLASATPLLHAQVPTSTIDSTLLAGLRWRNIGPANMSGRIVDVEGIPGPSRTFYVATAAGGIWKTTNAGTTFQLVFGDNQPVISMGDVAIAPSDTNIVWAGTGEPNSRNSISPGGGIFKSTDGGRTWKLMGLEKTQAIGRVVVHPTNPNIVYVAALGAPWNSNPERGLYKTTDGGATWTLAKFISDKAGFVDVEMDPSNPEILYAASWERQRGPYYLQSGGPGSAMWKTTDGGATWTELKGGGLPETMKGRIEFAVAKTNPQIVYAMVEADTTPNPRPTAGARQQTRPSGLYRSNDAGATWTRVAPQNVRPFYYSQVRVDTRDPERVYFSSTPHLFSTDGGKTVRSFSQGLHVDTHAHWIDPNDPNYQVVGNDGGIGVTFDRGGNWIFANTFPVGQFYNISYDMGVPYRVCGGLQDNGSWCGPSRRRGGITNSSWYNVGGGDGFGTQQDQTNPNIVFATSQGGNIQRRNIATGEGGGLAKPQWR
ncbi:MAG TPA: sialidase family protein, partial [Gemmatimonadales bacterium]|nr:sialidase family protein [Gemmatimonadales bacterium]